MSGTPSPVEPVERDNPPKRLLLAAIVPPAIAAFLVPPPGDAGRVQNALMDLAHAPAFALLTLAVVTLGFRESSRRLIRTAAAVWLLATAAGGLIEVLQNLVGRNGTWPDAVANSLGAAAGVLLANSRLRWNVRWIVPLVLLGAASWAPSQILFDRAMQPLEMPRLASFETSRETTRWTTKGAEIDRVRSRSTHGDWSLQIRAEAGEYPGVALQWPEPDWSAYGEFAFDVYVDGDEPISLAVKIHDDRHNYEPDDRFERLIPVSPGWNTVRIHLTEVRHAPASRELDLRRISFVQFFLVQPERPQTFYLDHLRLSAVGSRR